MKFTRLENKIQIESPAKLNLYLEIVGKRPDGYHGLVTVMQEISLHDVLEISAEGREGISFTSTDPTLPMGGDNLIVRAARRFLEKHRIDRGIRIHLVKKIPAAAGMGGGSSNASATLVALNLLFDKKISQEGLAAEAGSIGSDCPFFIWGGTSICSGRGEIVNPVSSLPPYAVLIVCPPTQTSTAQVYRALVPPSLEGPPKVDWVVEELRSGDIERIRKVLFNRLEEVACKIHPELALFQEKLANMGVPQPRLTGSGSALYGIFATTEQAQDMLAKVEGQLGGAHRGVFVAQFSERGAM